MTALRSDEQRNATAPPSAVQIGPCNIRYDERVLAPRPWTLLQSRWAAELSPLVPDGQILELCAGAGHIGLVAAVECGRRLIQVDVDPVACEFARSNALRAGIGERVVVRCESLDVAVLPAERFPLILADPPYLPTHQVGDWPSDPVRAIDGGPDGLELARRCAAVVASALDHNGAALMQLAGQRQVDELDQDLPEELEIREIREFDPWRAIVLIQRKSRV